MKLNHRTLFVVLILAALVGRAAAQPAQGRSALPDGYIDSRAFYYYIEGVIAEQEGQIAQAAEMYKRALQIHPRSQEIRLSFAGVLYRQGRQADVLEALSVVDPVDARVWRLRAAAYSGLGFVDSTAMANRRIMECDPDDRRAYSFLASHFQRIGDLDSAVWAFENIARLSGGDYVVWYDLARLCLRAGQLDRARSSLETSVSLDRSLGNITAFALLGQVMEELGAPDSAAALFKQALALDPNSLPLNRALASHYLRKDSLDQAVGYARLVAGLLPDDADAARALGMIYAQLDSLGAADSVFRALAGTGDRHPDNHLYLGRIALAREEFQRARDEFVTLTEIAPEAFQGWELLGLAYRRLDLPDREIATYEQGLERVTDDAGRQRLLFDLGAALEQADREDEAVEVFESLLKLAPDNANAMNYLGYMLADAGLRLDYARDLIERALGQQPDNAAFLDSYGWVLYRLGEFHQALVHLRRAASLDNDAVIFDHLGDAYHAVDSLPQARHWWQEALNRDQNNDQIKKKLGH